MSSYIYVAVNAHYTNLLMVMGQFRCLSEIKIAPLPTVLSTDIHSQTE
jgi:hypothetical protein